MDKKKWIIAAVVLVLLLAGASLLYSQLSKDFAPDSIVEDNTEGEVSGDVTGDGANDGGQAADQEDADSDEEPQLQPAPDFTMVDWDGNSVKLSDYFGKPVVLNFWASWCGPCKSEMPDFEEVYQQQGKAIQFLMVNVTGGRETLESAKTFIEESGYTFPVFFDTQTEGAMAYGTYSIPMTFFINADGNLVAYVQGMTSSDVLLQGIGMITE